MKFFWNRPRSKFSVGQLVSILASPENPRTRYFLINKCRWGRKEKSWFYNGTIFKIEDGELVWSTFGYTFGEDNFAKISGL